MNTVTKEAYEGDIVSRLQNWRGLHLAHSGGLFEEAATEIARLRLTAEEREAVTGMACYFDTRGNLQMQAWGSLLRILLERLR